MAGTHEFTFTCACVLSDKLFCLVSQGQRLQRKYDKLSRELERKLDSERKKNAKNDENLRRLEQELKQAQKVIWNCDLQSFQSDT